MDIFSIKLYCVLLCLYSKMARNLKGVGCTTTYKNFGASKDVALLLLLVHIRKRVKKAGFWLEPPVFLAVINIRRGRRLWRGDGGGGGLDNL